MTDLEIDYIIKRIMHRLAYVEGFLSALKCDYPDDYKHCSRLGSMLNIEYDALERIRYELCLRIYGDPSRHSQNLEVKEETCIEEES